VQFGDYVDLKGNELRNARVGTVGSLPTASTNKGVLVLYNDVVYWSDGSTWQAAMSGGGAPSGPAGGGLTGSYPNPTIATDAVGAAQISAGAVGTSELADGSVTGGTAGAGVKIAAATITDANVATANKDGAAGTASLRTLGTGAQQAVSGTDARLSDTRVPTDNSVTNAKMADDSVGSAEIIAGAVGTSELADGSVTGGTAGAGVKIAALTITDANIAAANKDGAAATPSLRTLGTGATQAVSGTDSRLSDQRVPTDNSVNAAKIVDGSVGTAELADGSVTGGTAGAGVKIAALTITNANISATAAIALSKLATDPLARGNHTGTQTASTISDLATVVQGYRLDQFAAPTSAVSFGSQRITSLATPTAASDAATKAYVDGLVSGLDAKASVRVATTANVTLTSQLENGDTIDGVTLATGDRVLVKNQTTPAENGIYTVNATGAPTRATDADSNGEISVGTQVYVETGTSNGGQIWVANATTAATWVPGTSGSTWALYFAVTPTQAGAGLTAAGNVLAVGQGTGITVNADDVAVDTSVVARKFISAALGDGTAVAFTITHSLANQWVAVHVIQTASPNEEIFTTIERTSTTQCIVRFSSAPAAGSFRVLVIG
jgi:hypothetical protein